MDYEFQALYEAYSRDIYRFLLRMVNYREDLAEELTQETFYQAFLSLHRYRGDCEIKTWLCQIAKNTCFKYYKKNPVIISLDGTNFTDYQEADLLQLTESMECRLERKELSACILQCIQKLKPKYKDVLIYRLYFELPFEKIGILLHIKENSAKVIYFRGKELLKQSLKPYLSAEWRNL